ncbi:hypothetical protein FO519_000191 [Halicephalobus sp. NKZ332]|nr:hypothetical protein FO519_000191 [Halicephalobus sp. NKZ332]
MPRAPVRLNVYDMYWINDYASVVGVGVYHSGIEVHGVEYAYGGHPYNVSGIFENQPGDAEELGENFKFKETIHLGETDFSSFEVKKMIENLGEEYRGDRYHLITKNCNHFSQYLAKTLTGSDIPPWINRLANMSGSIPFFERWIPEEWLTPVALQQSLEERNKQDGNASINYPVPVGRDALEGYNSPGTSKRNSSSASSKQGQNNFKEESIFSGAASFFSGSKSAPNSARSSTASQQNGVVSNFTKIWVSIKNLATDAPIPAPAPQANGSSYRPATTSSTNSSTQGHEKSEQNGFSNHLILFFLGKNKSSLVNKAVELEAQTFSDIVIIDFVDSYRNLSMKAFSIFVWKESYCKESKFMLKTDDDTVVDLKLLQKFIDSEENRLSKSEDRRRIYGNIIQKAIPKRQENSKWFLTPSEYTEPYFPDYCNGASCLFTKDAVRSILHSVPRTKFFWIDDVLFMGIIPRISKITLMDMSGSFGSVDLKGNWQSTCDFFPDSGVISFYVEESDFEKTDKDKLECPPTFWFWKQYSAWKKLNLELFFGF